MPSINDNFADAIEVTIATDGGTYTSDPIANTGNTTETNEPVVGSSGSLSMWFKYTPTSSGTATFDTQLTTAITSTDSYMAIWTGTALTNLVNVAADDDGGGSGKSRVAGMSVTAGTTYWIQCAGYGNHQMNMVLRVTGPETTGGGTPPGEGSGTGTVTFTGSASGSTVRRGTGSGSLVFAGAATGSAPSVDPATGSGNGTLAFVGAASGKRYPRGSSTGAVAWSGAATGSAPAVDGASGSGVGSVAWSGAATGARTPKGTGSGSLALVGTATGTTTRAGTATGLLTFTGTATGRSAAATQVVVGAPVAHRYTTATPRPRHLSGTPLPPRYTRRT